jgi:DNA-binding transcriptional ArsR family regulator
VVAYGDAFGALGDPTRRAVFERLGSGPQAVSELAAGLPVSRPAVSQHLRVLREAGLVTEHREGTRRIYALAPRGVADLRSYFDKFWTQALDSFQAAAEAKHAREQEAKR